MELNFLDHVAIRVKDLNLSANWYKSVLGLKIMKTKEWGDYPIFLLADKTGIALFPANQKDPLLDNESLIVRIDHFAFNVDNKSFLKFQSHLKNLEIPFVLKDHHYFESIYFRDPDHHEVELTTLKPEHKEFYKQE